MAEVIHEHEDTSSGMGFFLAIVLFVMVIIFLIYGLPVLRQGNSGPQINIPDKVDVNIKGPNQ